MIYFVSTLKVQLLIWTLVYASVNSESIKGHLPDLNVISHFLEQFLKPYIQSVKLNNGSPFRAKEESSVEKAIRKKIAALTPFLQDEVTVTRTSINETDDNLALEGKDETTIIEFVPKANMKSEIKKYKDKPSHRDLKPEKEKDNFRKNIKKYKQLRETIKNLLDKEKAGSKTKKIITRTLDDMLSQLIESKCIWKTVDSPNLQTHVFRSQKNTHKSINKLHKLSKQDWKNMRKQYLNFLEFKQDQEDTFMKQFHDFFTSVMNDTWNLSSRYKVRCQLVKVEDQVTNKKKYLREDTAVDKDKCDGFKVCSEELKEFLTNFYKYVNDTAVSIFRNYAAMYVRDVNVDFGLDKDIVVSVLESMSKTVEKKVSKLFKKELEKFTLDENKNKAANIQHINDFIAAVIDHAKKALKKNLDRELNAMKTKLFTTVKDDLSVNLRVDMDNLAKLFTDRICSLFIVCNGRYATRRLQRPFNIGEKETDNIYVKVQLTFDDEFKDSVARGASAPRIWQGKDMTHRFNKLFNQNERKYNIVNVTRTTLAPSESTVSTTVNTTQSTLVHNVTETVNDRNTTIK